MLLRYLQLLNGLHQNKYVVHIGETLGFHSALKCVHELNLGWMILSLIMAVYSFLWSKCVITVLLYYCSL